MKKILTGILCLSLCFVLIGCSDKKEDSSDSTKAANETKFYTFDDLKADLTATDSTTEVIKKEASYIGGTEGYGYKMKECLIEVYKFDKDSKEYKAAESNQKLEMPSFNMTFDAVVRNGYAYMVTDGNCDSVIPTVEKIMK